MSEQDSISVRCYGAIRGNGSAYVELYEDDNLSIVVGRADLHLMMSVQDWKKIAAAVDRLVNGPLKHRVNIDDIAGIATVSSITTPVSS